MSLTLTSTNPADLALGLAIGVPTITAGAGGCDLTAALSTTAGSDPQLQATIDAGTYCAGVFDPGTIGASAAGFALTITYP